MDVGDAVKVAPRPAREGVIGDKVREKEVLEEKYAFCRVVRCVD